MASRYPDSPEGRGLRAALACVASLNSFFSLQKIEATSATKLGPSPRMTLIQQMAMSKRSSSVSEPTCPLAADCQADSRPSRVPPAATVLLGPLWLPGQLIASPPSRFGHTSAGHDCALHGPRAWTKKHSRGWLQKRAVLPIAEDVPTLDATHILAMVVGVQDQVAPAPWARLSPHHFSGPPILCSAPRSGDVHVLIALFMPIAEKLLEFADQLPRIEWLGEEMAS